MDIKKKQRKVIRTAFTKVANELDNLLASQDQTEEDLRRIQVTWELIISKHDLLKSIDGEIYEALLEADATEDDLLADMESKVHEDSNIDLEDKIAYLIQATMQLGPATSGEFPRDGRKL
ncbi:hypothetical protein NQ318_009348 [Aromia moschata]|uniref:Uncharacterized protein n=1 Tax=Aromia moschata TaxID=1265417 RepID=A0AAV8X4E7_9CUCU|nr:hypothetical protein NQ318_009348 [Aromia moschata]